MNRVSWLFRVVNLTLVFVLAAPFTSASAMTSAEKGGPTSQSLPDGGTAYYFPANFGSTQDSIKSADSRLMASGVGVPPSAQFSFSRDDRENTDPIPWAVYEHQTTADILNTASVSNYRVVDLAIEPGSNPIKFSAVYVSNTGTYNRAWWLLVGSTPTDLLNFAVANNARIIVQKALPDPNPAGTVLFYSILIPNTGADSKTWFFYKDQTVAGVTSLWQTNNARLVQVNSYVRNATTYYDVVMISNTGADARTWYWYVGDTPDQLAAHVTALNARVVDLDYDAASGTYSAIMNSCSGGCPAWWWYFGVSTANLISTVTSVGARLVDVNPHAGCGDQCWDILMIENSNTVIAGNAGMAGVTLTYNNGGTKTVTSDGSGYYSFSVPTGWSGTVVPTKTGYVFSPAYRSYSGTYSGVLSENYSPAAHATFNDVPTYFWSWLQIETLVKNGITSGCSNAPKLYCPTWVVSRDQMAVFLLRAEHGGAIVPPAPTGIFADVPVNYWAAGYIELLAAEGITSGCSSSPKNYCPTAPVTRDQMAIFLLRAKHGSAYTPPSAVGIFADVPVSYWAAPWIEELAAEGVTSGCGTAPLRYCPTSPVTRDQMAVFLVRMFGLN